MLRKFLIFLAFVCPALAQTNYARMLAGVDYQSGTTYSVQPVDSTKLLSLTNAGSVAVCLSSPGSLCSGVAAGSGSFYGAGSQFSIANNGGGTVTITCQGCTINGASTLALGPAVGADIYGDGTNFAAIQGFTVSAGSGGTAKPGDIIRWNVNGDNAWDAVGYPQLYDGVFACSINVSCASGMYVGTAPTGCCSEAVVGVNPTQTNPFFTTEYQNNVTSTNGIIGLLHVQNGNNGLFHIRGFWKMSFKAAISAISNSRFYWGFGVWANASSLGTNGTQPIGTTAFATDTPNHSFVGWRWSSTTDTNFKCLAIQAGSSPTTVIVDSGIVADSNLHSFDITLDQANTVFTCYLDGKQVGTIPASTLTFTPTNSSDALGSIFFTGDDKNIATGGIQFTLANMFLSVRQ